MAAVNKSVFSLPTLSRYYHGGWRATDARLHYGGKSVLFHADTRKFRSEKTTVRESESTAGSEFKFHATKATSYKIDGSVQQVALRP